MDNAQLKIKKAQVFIEASLAFVAVIILLLGIIRFWLWYNNDMAERQPPYSASRVTAGSSIPGQWPPPGSTRRPITEEWVFGGDLPAAVPYTSGGTAATGRTANTECEDKAKSKEDQARTDMKQSAELKYAADVLDNEAAELESQANTLDAEAASLDAEAASLEAQAAMYDSEYANCISGCSGDPDCEAGCVTYNEQAALYASQAAAKRSQAADKRASASNKRTQAANDRTEATNDRTEADNLVNEANNLFDEAYNVRTNCNNIPK